MPQKTNLNINPYYDDFNKEDNFYKVLFKPGFPVQARELTTLQSELQNQIESFGSHMFKEGSMVVPGNVNYDSQHYSIRINEEHLGIPVSLYVDQLIGKRLKGETSGIVVSVDSYKLAGDTPEITNLTLFINYVESGEDNTIAVLEDGEQLIIQETITYGNTPINEGETVATLVDSDASAIGCAVGISSGVYFIRGTFVDVATDILVLDPYTNTPSYRVGLNIDEQIITAKEDPKLYDNARGFSNYAAPGADRFKISTTLSKKSLTDNNDTSFVELVRLDNGELKKLQNKTQYSLIKDYFAQRTFDESGSYSVDPFQVDIANSLNNGIGNEGVFKSNEVTEQGNTPSNDLMAVKVSAGKAYVKGYDSEKIGTTILDVAKPRDTQTVDSSLVSYEFGTKIKVNNVFGTPAPNIVNSAQLLGLYDQRSNSNTAGTGSLIGSARVYTCNLTDSTYRDDSTTFDLYLFDIQIYTTIVMNVAVSTAQMPAGAFIRGLSSGATGYAVVAGGNTNVHEITQTSGSFIKGEAIIINEDPELSRSLNNVIIRGPQDVKSVFQDASVISGYNVDFVADVVLSDWLPDQFNGLDKISINGAGISTVTGKNWSGVNANTIIKYQKPDKTVPTYNRINTIDPTLNKITLATCPSIVGVNDGTLPPATGVESTFTLGVPNIDVQNNRGLYAPLGETNIADVNLANATLIVTKNLLSETTDGNGSMTASISDVGITSAFFEAFDAERYSVLLNNGEYRSVSSDQFVLGADGQSFTINGLDTNQTNMVVKSTVKKKDIKSKQKNFVRSQKKDVVFTAVGINTLASGLPKNQFYGLRLEDKEISLNVPDAVNIVGVYESIDTAAPILDKLVFISGLNLDTNSILGEHVTGATSGAVAQITNRNSATTIEIAYLTPMKFVIGESVTFAESNIVSNLQNITVGSYLNITNRYTLDKGQREQYYDYSRIVRKPNFAAPANRLTVVFNSYVVPSSDTGDVYTVESYSDERFGEDVPHLANGLRASDTLDFRPRVVPTSATNMSPLFFSNREFDSSGNVNPTNAVSPNESSILGYTFYLPRTDKVCLDTLGNLSVIKGTSSIDPQEPANIENAMTIATVELPAYLYSPEDAKVTLVDNVRYTMRDIGKLEDRIENLEVVTSLSLLELDTKTFQVQDADGLSRFKTGFFVDDFKNNHLLDLGDPDCKCDVNIEKKELTVPLDFYSLKPQLALRPDIDIATADFSTNLELLDSNVQKTGDLITLKYTEKSWIDQPLASRVENVNPFNMVEFTGIIDLSPSTDNWVRNIQIDGGQRQITGGFNGTYIETIKTSSYPDTHIRSRNVGFSAYGLRPVARFYPFFDGTSGIDTIPKLVEIDMQHGIFQKGETVDVYASGGQHVAVMRLAQLNHKTGDINNPTLTYNANPYNTTSSLGTAYSASSTILNIDINSLTDEAQGSYWGYIPSGNDIVFSGRSSGAEAKVSTIRLVADTFGDLLGSFWFRDPLASPPPPLRWRIGTRTFKLTSSSTNATPLPGSLLISSGETTYTAVGRVDEYTNTLVIVRRPPPPPPRRDPLAQSFTTDETGAFLTGVDLYFANKDDNEKITVEVRTVELGTPTLQVVADYARVTLEPSQINTSSNAEVATRVTFPSPVYLEADSEYAIVILAPTTNLYEAWIAQMGERTVNTQSLPDAESVMVTRQYVGGSLFKSQNGSIWTPSQFEDLKFKLYKAEFTTEPGTVYFYNSALGTQSNQIPRLDSNAVTTLPRKLKVGHTSTNNASIIAKLAVGEKVSEGTTLPGPTGTIEGVGGPINTLAVSGIGTDYANASHSNVPLYSITGNGSNAQATVVVAGGTVLSATISAAGSGYQQGDVLGITTASAGLKGSGATLTVSATTGYQDTIYLSNVHGEEFTTGQNLFTYPGGTRTTVNPGINVTSSALTSDLYAGNVLKVEQYNHGMTADTNVVTLSDINPDTPPVLLTNDLALGDQIISVASTASFATYNGISTTTGYVKINNEIIYYTSVGTGNNQLGIGTRGVEGTTERTHNVNAVAYKYEINGYGLERINRNHNLPAALKKYRDIDKYHVQLGRESLPSQGLDSGDNQLSFNTEMAVGGVDIFASQNFQYNQVIPQFNTLTPSDETTIETQIRTVSGTSASGNEISFVDQGYENITLNRPNRLETPRIVCSEINEVTRLTTMPKNKSVTLGVQFNTEDTNLSPVLDVMNGTIVYERSRLNSPINNYAKDAGSDNPSGDPHAAVYITKKVDLKNPATSLKVMVAAYRHSTSDFRMLYQLFKEDSTDTEESWELFPGYNNLNVVGSMGDRVINPANNDGRPDRFIPASDEGQFLEYQFTSDSLTEFTGFRIKMVSSGTNEAYAPKFKDFRVIALA